MLAIGYSLESVASLDSDDANVNRDICINRYANVEQGDVSTDIVVTCKHDFITGIRQPHD
jgi:hypothetical protein